MDEWEKKQRRFDVIVFDILTTDKILNMEFTPKIQNTALMAKSPKMLLQVYAEKNPL